MTERWVRITNKTENVYDGFFKISKISYEFQGIDGQSRRHSDREICDRGDAVSVLVYNQDQDIILLVRQIRAPLIEREPATSGWLIETVAGMPRPSEPLDETAKRETLEETGYDIKNCERIGSFYSSPGGSSEQITLYFATVTEQDKVGESGGVEREGEHIEVVEFSAREFIRKLEEGHFVDPKIIFSGGWFRGWYGKPANREQDRKSFGGVAYQYKDKDAVEIGIRAGSIEHVDDVEIWVNSENSMMMMDRFDGRTISAMIRYLAADKNQSDSEVINDPMQTRLNESMGDRYSVPIGEVIETEAPARLKKDKNVDYVLHVATVVPDRDTHRFRTSLQQLQLCVDNALKRANQLSSKGGIFSGGQTGRAVLLPLLGTGDGGMGKREVIEMIVERIGAFIDQQKVGLRAIYILAYSREDAYLLNQAFEQQGSFKTREPEQK